MSGATGLDLRYPIGGLFTILGLLLAGWGVATNGDPGLYARSANVNINLWWGVVLLVTGRPPGGPPRVRDARGARHGAARARPGAGALGGGSGASRHLAASHERELLVFGSESTDSRIR